MNDLMKAAVGGTDLSWTATLPLLLFFLVFLGVVAWTVLANPAAPDLEV